MCLSPQIWILLTQSSLLASLWPLVESHLTQAPVLSWGQLTASYIWMIGTQKDTKYSISLFQYYWLGKLNTVEDSQF